MNNMQETIADYERSVQPLRQRILQINRMLCGEAPIPAGNTVKSLEARRYHLYCELAELIQAIDAMRDYLRCSKAWPVAFWEDLSS